ncbi:MAG: zinc ribbon domain-containing protein [Lachnospiraceae bacterium]|nr:zinc ribbon domain-containing protein [Lachnospiraceae bacterium]
MFCEQCGSKIEDGTKFCTNCGASVMYDAPAQQLQVQTTPPPQVQTPQAIQQPYQQQPYQQPYQQAQQQYPIGNQPKKQVPAAVIVIIAVFAVLIIGVTVLVVAFGNSGKTAVEDGVIGDVAGENENAFDANTGETDGKVKIPEGAEIITDANLMDLVGEYEGEIQLTRFEGMENMPGADEHKAEIDSMMEKLMNEPQKCTLEIEDDGNWELDIDAPMGSMDLDSSGFRMRDPKTPADESAHLIQLVNNGCYSVVVKQQEEVNSKEMGSGTTEETAEHIGTYCKKGDKKIITGYIHVSMSMGGTGILMQGDFVVDKTTGDYIPEGGEEAIDTTNGKDDDETGSIDEDINNDVEVDDDLEVDDENSDPDSSSGNIDTKEPSQTAITGGKWDIMESGESQYLLNGEAVRNTWTEDKGRYFYVGPDGCLVHENYAPDGYWIDKDGSWDKSVPRQELQFEPYNNDYIGRIQTFEITMDNADTGRAKVYYTGMGGKKMDFRIERLGISSYAAYSDVNEDEIYLISVVDDGESIIVSCDGQTEKCTIQ